MESLTKEYFWNEMEQKYPKAMAHFQNWIDGYKNENRWGQLFNAGIQYQSSRKTPIGRYIDTTARSVAPKYHELPIAMQFGIFMEYIFNLDFPGLAKGITLETRRVSPYSEAVSELINLALKQVEDLL